MFGVVVPGIMRLSEGAYIACLVAVGYPGESMAIRTLLAGAAATV